MNEPLRFLFVIDNFEIYTNHVATILSYQKKIGKIQWFVFCYLPKIPNYFGMSQEIYNRLLAGNPHAKCIIDGLSRQFDIEPGKCFIKSGNRRRNIRQVIEMYQIDRVIETNVYPKISMKSFNTSFLPSY